MTNNAGPQTPASIAMVRVDCDALKRFAHAALLAMGVAPADAEILAGALLYSELRFHPGQGQGVRRLRVYRERLAAAQVDPRAPFEVVKESPALALVDAHNGLGTVAAIRAMRLAIAKAKVCRVGTRSGRAAGRSGWHPCRHLEPVGRRGTARTCGGDCRAAAAA